MAPSSPLLNPSSLILSSFHSDRILKLMKSKVDVEMLAFVAQRTCEIISVRSLVSDLPTPPTTPVKSTFDQANSSKIPSVIDFLIELVEQSGAQVPTIVCAYAYLERLGRKLPVGSLGSECTRHRVLLCCFILAAKYFNDCCPRNKHWKSYMANIMAFSQNELNLMERQLLGMLDFELRIDSWELEDRARNFFPVQYNKTKDNASACMLPSMSLESCASTYCDSLASTVDSIDSSCNIDLIDLTGPYRNLILGSPNCDGKPAPNKPTSLALDRSSSSRSHYFRVGRLAHAYEVANKDSI